MPRVVLQPDADRPPVPVRLVCRPAGCCGKPTHEASTAERSLDSAGLCPSHARMAARLFSFSFQLFQSSRIAPLPCLHMLLAVPTPISGG